MSRLQFVEAKAVFEAFPTLAGEIETPPTQQPPLDFLRELLKSPKPDDAIIFSACLMPRRMVVWWASQCVRAMLAAPTAADRIALDTAEDWVRAPDETRRNEALRIGISASSKAASTWVANAAGWSGGSIMLDNPQGPPAPPHLTAAAARNALALLLAGRPDREAQIAKCVDKCIELAQS